MKTDLDSYLFVKVSSDFPRKEEGNRKKMTTNEWDEERKERKMKINTKGRQTKTRISTRSEKI